MKQILKISFTILTLQLVFSQAQPTTQSPNKDTIYDFLLEKSFEVKSSEALLFALSHSKLFQYTVEFFESQKGVEQIDSQTLTELKKELLHFNESIENLKKDKNSCLVQRDVSNQIAHLRTRTRDHLHKDEEQIAHWRNQEKIDGKLQDDIYKGIFKQMYDQLPQVVETYKAALSEAQKKEFEASLAGEPNLYAALYAIYKAKKEATPAVATSGDGYCDNFEISLVAAYLHRIKP